ncbi:hypothetical protein CCO03_17300 [Comamonas serinivorans]|uniref:SnoaL-like domain-containing protein n=1 Tax=Comamonas serinivorans TaxID=1082851 RepID=A0A1Y0ERJ4_9BURK|nr:nuclear transport factor 2 family protein [Comamonas serinivorans]ARU06196.1 hypothetical protein CCO03_17300 [Comamonas serinivorans]
MSTSPATAQPVPAAVLRSLAVWHDILTRNAMEELDPLLSDEIVFRSPVAFTPYPGRAAIKLILKTVNTVFSQFEYHRTFFSEDGLSVTLEFSANVGDKRVKGVDIVRFNADGQMLEFEVMVRPMSGLAALAEQMGAKLAPHAHLLGAK